MQLPALTVIMTLFVPPIGGPYGGFSRLQTAKQTMMSWGRHMRYTGDLRLHVSNDSVAVQDAEVHQSVEAHTPWPFSITHTHGAGLGAALNLGLREAFKASPLVIYADDSYSLIADLDLTPWASVLMQHEDIGAIGLMPPRPHQRGEKVAYFHNIETEGVAAMRMEKHDYAWNGRPLLYHQRFFDAYGYTPEGGTGYEWEQAFAETYVNKDGPAVVYAFIDPWQHVWSVLLGNAPPGWSGNPDDG